MSPTLALLVTLDDGRTLPLADCTWVHRAPCGCPVGVALAGYYPPDPAKVWAEAFTYNETAREVERDRRLGYTLTLVAHDTNPARHITTVCLHKPRLGRVPLPPAPDGRVWGTAAPDGPGARTSHLLTLDDPDPTNPYRANSPYWRSGAAWCRTRQPAARSGLRNPDWYIDPVSVDPDYANPLEPLPDGTDELLPDGRRRYRRKLHPDMTRTLREALECAACLTQLAKATGARIPAVHNPPPGPMPEFTTGPTRPDPAGQRPGRPAQEALL